MIALMVSVARFFIVLQAILSLAVLALMAGLLFYADGAFGIQQLLIVVGSAFLLLVVSGFAAVLFQINDRLGMLIDVTKEAGGGVAPAAAPVQPVARRVAEPALRANRD